MCGRFVSPEQAAIERAFGLGRRGGNPFQRRYNVYPTETIAFLRVPSNAGELELDRKLTDPAKVKAIADLHLPAEAAAHWKVRLLVNNTEADGPELIEPAEGDDQGCNKIVGQLD